MKNRSSQTLDEHLTSMMVLIPVLLTERGSFSHQPFMPEVNHRHIDHHVMQYEHANGRAIMRAFANPEPNEWFNNRPIILSPYQVKEVDSHLDGLTLKTFTTCQINGGFQMLHSKNLEFEHVSGDCFKRLCGIFGYQWVDEKGDVISRTPKSEEIASFFQLFNKFSFESTDLFCRFLQHFELNPLFEYHPLETLEWNIFSFGCLLQSLCSFRFSITEGQHRWWCLSGVFQGLFESTSHAIPRIAI